MASGKTLPIPEHFDPDKVSRVWRVPYQQREAEARSWARGHRLGPAREDRPRVCLMLVDCQNSFCIPDFELFVAGRSGMGAVEDNIRLCRFIYEHIASITEIVCTMDTHKAMQIFHSAFWANAAGEPPAPMTAITLKDVETGAWRVSTEVSSYVSDKGPEFLERYALHYVKELSRRGKYDLTIWPYHAMLGGIGHALVSSVEEAAFFHNVARGSQTLFEIKGEMPLTEHYSVLSPEVRTDQEGLSTSEKNQAFIARLMSFDAVIIAGQAKSHCVAWTIDDLLKEIEPKDARKVYLLEDCTSAVVVPGVVDFTEQADQAFRGFSEAGMHVVRSTDPIENWPGMPR
ncbi:MAG: isochorismatase [Thermodesulfobacteriota bacterium]